MREEKQHLVQVHLGGAATHTPACPWAVRPPAERSNMKRPSGRPPLQGRRSGQHFCPNRPLRPRGGGRTQPEQAVAGSDKSVGVRVCVSGLTGSLFLGGFRVLEGTEETLAEIRREVLHLQIRLQEETEAFLIDALEKQMKEGGMDIQKGNKSVCGVCALAKGNSEGSDEGKTTKNISINGRLPLLWASWSHFKVKDSCHRRTPPGFAELQTHIFVVVVVKSFAG